MEEVKKSASMLVLVLLFYVVLVSLPQIEVVKAEGMVYIRADGNIDPSTAPIQRNEEDYTLVGNIEDYVILERNHTVFDGTGYTVGGISGPPVVWTEDKGWHTNSTTDIMVVNTVVNGGGITFVEASNSTIANNTLNGGRGISWGNGKENMVYGNRITNSNSTGIYVGNTNNTVIGNYIIGTNGTAISLSMSSYNNTIAGNQIENNKVGISTLSIYSQGGTRHNFIYNNNFINNTKNVSNDIVGPTDVSVNFWDNVAVGNYWSDYNGTDNNGDGIGDTPYIIDENNQDNYPLMNPVEVSVIPEFPSWILLLVVLDVPAIALAVYRIRLTRIVNQHNERCKI
jgi:hypothetical protein